MYSAAAVGFFKQNKQTDRTTHLLVILWKCWAMRGLHGKWTRLT